MCCADPRVRRTARCFCATCPLSVAIRSVLHPLLACIPAAAGLDGQLREPGQGVRAVPERRHRRGPLGDERRRQDVPLPAGACARRGPRMPFREMAQARPPVHAPGDFLGAPAEARGYPVVWQPPAAPLGTHSPPHPTPHPASPLPPAGVDHARPPRARAAVRQQYVRQGGAPQPAAAHPGRHGRGAGVAQREPGPLHRAAPGGRVGGHPAGVFCGEATAGEASVLWRNRDSSWSRCGGWPGSRTAPLQRAHPCRLTAWRARKWRPTLACQARPEAPSPALPPPRARRMPTSL